VRFARLLSKFRERGAERGREGDDVMGRRPGFDGTGAMHVDRIWILSSTTGDEAWYVSLFLWQGLRHTRLRLRVIF
jgi:hypothetical protein